MQISRDKKNCEAKEQPVNIRRGHGTFDPNITEEMKDASHMLLRSSSRIIEHEQEASHECERSVCLLEQKRKVVSSNIDVPQARYAVH